ncbi:MAG TPA: hypothetical protein VLI90_12570, partial [Tepidisphaeraceae bacterium]|nr:hypothetical protein [Tepidisphaeraceae bacterium]
AIATESNGVTVEPWDLSTGQKTTGEPLKLKTRPASKFAISTDGKRIAWVATFPKHSVQVWSFDTGKATMAIDWEAARGDPELIGFSAPNRLLLRWGNTSASADIDVVNVDAKARVATFKVNQLQGKHPIAVSPAAQRLLVASKVKGIPTLIQYDLNDGQPILYTKIVDLDPALPVDARGLAYSNDGKRMAIYIENPEGALLVSYDSDGSQKPVSLVYPDGPTPGVAHDNFADNALTSLDPSPCWLIYGDAVIDAKTNDVLANLGVKNVIANRVLDNDHVELVTSDGSKVQVKVATIDRSKLQALTATPTPAPQVSLH